jgi:hypothetical protein
MDSLSDSHLIFEIHAKRAENRSLWFRGDPKLSEPLCKIEKYLNGIVKEGTSINCLIAKINQDILGYSQ